MRVSAIALLWPQVAKMALASSVSGTLISSTRLEQGLNFSDPSLFRLHTCLLTFGLF